MGSEILIPIFICVVLPVAIVAIVSYTKIKNKKIMADTLLAALDKNPDMDIKNLFDVGKPQITPEQKLVKNFRTGLITLVMGAGLLALSLLLDKGYGDQGLQLASVILMAVGIGFTAAYFVEKKAYKAEKNKIQE